MRRRRAGHGDDRAARRLTAVIPLYAVRPRTGGDLEQGRVFPMSGLEMTARSVAGASGRPITRLTALRLSDVGPGMASAWMPASPGGSPVRASSWPARPSHSSADMALGAAVLTERTSRGSARRRPGAPVPPRPDDPQPDHHRPRPPAPRQALARPLRGDSGGTARGRLLGHASSRCRAVSGGFLAMLRAPSQSRRGRRLGCRRAVSASRSRARSTTATTGTRTPGLTVMRPGRRRHVPSSLPASGLARTGGRTRARWRSRCRLRDGCRNAFGVLYGGALAFLADATIILAAGSTVPAGTAFNTIDLKLYFLRPVRPGEGSWSPRAKTVHRGSDHRRGQLRVTGPDGAVVAAGDRLGPDPARQTLGTPLSRSPHEITAESAGCR